MVLRLFLLASIFFLAYCSVPERNNPYDPDGVNYKTPVIYEGGSYQTVEIGTQTWFKWNLNYAVEGSKCYDNKPANCDTYGRLYDWATAMALDPGCNSSKCSEQIQPKHRGICPEGWHIPNRTDWEALIKFAKQICCTDAGAKLKSANGWNDYNGTSGGGTNDFGFSALPGGYGKHDGSFGDVGNYGHWVGTEEYADKISAIWGLYRGNDLVYNDDYYNKDGFYSVRCLKD